ncbi:serine/threonine-protein kinase [Microbulbifer sp. YPW16]|uniref:serine/threonine-protein kinase n=1 Tax=Microbulbifer sp. YPW16 TaxID=2904242 RepID=UPI001E498BA5|nr:serine/threonine-protein kinase [Microbulbifer sp. YPW16]UHQ56723.1 protein kinase [Microbulbifer sp. YPW16]
MSEEQPEQIGRYKITGQLGAGGMGVVYLAIDEHLQRRVAIKRLISNPSSDTAHLRIRQEAKLLAQLNHSNIVQIYDVVEEAGKMALVMEFVDGCTLSQWQRERNPGLAQKLDILDQVCAGLARAHSIGIIHRDLKADNILVNQDNTAKITDFGIAKNWREESDLTREQHVAGSWGAMSPEQALGRPLDNRCDLFALGVLAYRLLTGQGPFGDHDSAFVIVDRIVNSGHPPAQKLNPELPAPLSHLLDRLLEKDPDKRPLSARAVAEELHNIRAALDAKTAVSTTSRTVTVTAESFHAQARRRQKQRKPLLAGAAIAVAAAVTLASLATLIPTTEKPKGKYLAILAPHEKNLGSREMRLLGNNILSALKQGLSNRQGLLLVPYSESRQLAGERLQDQVEALNADLLLHPSLSCEGQQCEVSLELIEADNLAVISNRTTTLNINEGLETRARTMQQLNYLLRDFPTRDGAAQANISETDYQRYLAIYDDKNSGSTDREQAMEALEAMQRRTPAFTPFYELYSELVIDQRFNTRHTDALDRLREFLALAPHKVRNHPDLLLAEVRLAIVDGNSSRAEALLDQLRMSLPDRATYYQLLHFYHQESGNYDKALAAINNALELRTSHRYLLQKAVTLSTRGDMEAARPLLIEALEIDKDNMMVISVLAANELDRGHPEETIRLLQNAPVEKLRTMDTYNLCLAYYIEKQFEQAQSCFAGASERAPKDADILLYQSEIARARGKTEQAHQLAERALSVTEGRDDWEGLLMRARAYAELGQPDRAISTLIRIRRTAPDDLYVNYTRAQVYIASGDLVSTRAHVEKTLELGVSPIWFNTARFAPICSSDKFAQLRREHPGLCQSRQQEPTRMAQGQSAGDEG